MAEPVTQKWSSQIPGGPLNEREFRQWRELLEHRVGIQITEQRRRFLQTNLSLRMKEIGCGDYQSYYNLVVDSTSGLMEWDTLVDRLTVQETRFFRDPAGFDLVRSYLRSRKPRSKAFNLWSVGCSTGEEPYSLAMVADQELGQSSPCRWSVTASDISQPALSKARAGKYPQRKLQTVEPDILETYFKCEEGWCQISDYLKDRVCFIRMNVLDIDKSPLGDFDIIYCQNLLIYFRRWRRKEITNHLAKHLAPGGLLILGSGELTDWHSTELTRISSESSLAYMKQKA
ncbi:CheR family methyltransferase [Gynuella sunshinyii]|uniref:protein-glutamate O-methyltransferase n=1 Tax=Gynuella sunshinyii YC6258 TaxID=1445510 RepID=A0A0C5VFV3_9GAMM|nr:CheR family methyltransferase [Gynuella sunshinyii]AJQ93477.1 methylase of chemotaxis methyl-accepting protein [Gynuella sunshinyii YC6258]